MGLLQKLLGRRLDETEDRASSRLTSDTVNPADEQPDTEPSPQQTGEPASSPVLADAAPLPDAPAPLPDAPAPRPTHRVPAPLHEWPGYPQDDSESATPPSAVSSDAEPANPEPTSPDAESASPPSNPDSSAAEPPPVDILSEDTPIEPVTETGASPRRRDLDDIFVPDRPRRELLDLEPPSPPTEEEKPSPTALPPDVSGSPRAALRAAGVAVPPMHQIVRRGDVRLWAFGVRAAEALGWWLQIRQVHDKTGWLPVLLGSPDDWLDNGESVLHEGEDEMRRIAEVDVSRLLNDKAAEAGEPPRGVPILPARGDSDFAVPKSDGLLGLIEADYGWQIPALLPWKGSTDWELYGAEHAAVLRHWHERHEVELVSMTWDILELYVPNPPTIDDDVQHAAEEVYAYCPDLMAAGVPTLDDLAQHMIRSRAWYFRWT